MSMLKCLLTAALGIAFTAAQAGPQDDTLVFASADEVSTIDKYYNTDRIGIIIAHHIFDTLVYKNPETNEIEPMLATSWKSVDDSTIEFQLREGVKFHNGEPFDADDVVYTLQHALDPAKKIRTAHNVAWIEGVEKTGPYTVLLKTKGPFPAALQYLAGEIPIYGNEYYAKVGPEGMDKSPVGSGPYKVARIAPGEAVYFERNEDYWKGGPRGVPAIKNLVFRSIADANTQVAELMTGSVDWIWRVSPDQGEALRANPMLTVQSGETMRVGYLSLDAAGRSGKQPFLDKRVRQAVAHALNREAIVKGLLGDGAQVINAMCFPPQVGCIQDVVKYDYNPEKARQLLNEAGYPDGFATSIAAYRDRPLAEAMLGDLRSVGIKADLNYGQYAAIRALARSGKSPVGFLTWGSFSINDVSAFTSALFTFTDDDMTRDEEIRDWLTKADRTIDLEERKALYRRALEKIAEEAYVLPLWSYPMTYAFNKELQFKPSVDELPRFNLSRWN